ncbi:50S ribosomal protein L4 [Halorhodospira neutriphila]|uniref:Large ribosomal subunit protein uL4 n=1 Tax=Halorhodospira neutriphila TaxID=168379 RepID=A0ABS1E5L4_9GAMM|nr:50S ribosomal protein L4 [Halorhodospira neutriphila]MBK1725666.1 50S ribosomal protein L4 [Halorhodospira neutriphila]
MELKLTSNQGEAAGQVEVADAAFAEPFREALIHQVVTAHLAGGRAGTKAQKTRSEVSGGGSKPWRQKGTGNARAGTNRSPLWRAGGQAFAAKPRSYRQKVNRKMYRGAIRSILSELVREQRLVVVESLALEAPKTRLLRERLQQLGVEHGLVVVDALEPSLALAARNLPGVSAVEAGRIDPPSLVGSEQVVMTVPAIRRVEEWLS